MKKSAIPKSTRTKVKLPELPVTPRGQDITVKVTSKEDVVDAPEEEAKLPIDELVKIATAKGLLKDETEEQRFDRFIKAIKLHDIIYDCMQSSFNEYCKAYNKKNPDDNLRIKIDVSKKKQKDSHAIWAVAAGLELRRGGVHKVLFEKRIEFTHIKQIREEASWKYALYGSIWNDIVVHAFNYLILQEDVKSGRIKSSVSA